MIAIINRAHSKVVGLGTSMQEVKGLKPTPTDVASAIVRSCRLVPFSK